MTDQVVLIVDDSETMRDIMKTYLESSGYKTVEAMNGAEAIEILKKIETLPTLIITDIDMPMMNGVELIEKVRRINEGRSIPILILTSQDQLEVKLKGFYAGADDYLIKPFNIEEFLTRVKITIARKEDLRALNPLTGLPGGIQVNKFLTKLIEDGSMFAVISIDIDDFKYYNNVYGFKKGDEVIEFLAELIVSQAALLSQDEVFVGHMGGDDFIVILDPEVAESFAKSIVVGFDEGIVDFYFPEDRERAYIISEDRKGTKHKIALMTLSAGIVTNEQRKLQSLGEVHEVSAELKEYLKRTRFSNVLKDRRKE